MLEPAKADHPTPPGDLEGLLRAIIVRYVKYRPACALLALVILAWGIWSVAHLPMDVTPDISNLQVQVLTPVPVLSPEEIETSVTRPIELEMSGLPGLEPVRSFTRFGISQVRLTFSDGSDLNQARQMVSERLANAAQKLPPGLTPSLAPPSSGLGEVFTYKTNNAAPTNSVEARLRRLKLVQEFVVKPCLKSVRLNAVVVNLLSAPAPGRKPAINWQCLHQTSVDLERNAVERGGPHRHRFQAPVWRRHAQRSESRAGNSDDVEGENARAVAQSFGSAWPTRKAGCRQTWSFCRSMIVPSWLIV